MQSQCRSGLKSLILGLGANEAVLVGSVGRFMTGLIDHQVYAKNVAERGTTRGIAASWPLSRVRGYDIIVIRLVM